MLTFIGLVHQKTAQRQHHLVDDACLQGGLRVGRAPDNTIAIDDPSIQAHHIEITRDLDRLALLVREGTARVIPFADLLTPESGKRSFLPPLSLRFGQLELRFFPLSFLREDIDSLCAALSPALDLGWPPLRPQRDAVLGCAESSSVGALSNQSSPREAQELWECLASRDLIPQEWLFSHSREFYLMGRLGLHPLSLQQAASLAMAPQAILTTESLIPDVLYAFIPWGVSGAKHVVWSAALQWREDTTPMESLAENLVDLLPSYRKVWGEFGELLAFLIPNTNPLAYTRALEWFWWWLCERNAHTELDAWSDIQLRRLPSATQSCSLRDLPNPFAPLRLLAELGVQLVRLSPDSDDIELCLIV